MKTDDKDIGDGSTLEGYGTWQPTSCLSQTKTIITVLKGWGAVALVVFGEKFSKIYLLDQAEGIALPPGRIFRVFLPAGSKASLLSVKVKDEDFVSVVPGKERVMDSCAALTEADILKFGIKGDPGLRF